MTEECSFRLDLFSQPAEELEGRWSDGNQSSHQGYAQAEQGPVACASKVGADGYDIRGGRVVAVVMVLVLDAVLVSVLEEALARKDVVVPGLAVCVVVVSDGAQEPCCQDGEHDPSQKTMLRRTEHH